MIDRLVDVFSQALPNERACYICKVPFRTEISSSLSLAIYNIDVDRSAPDSNPKEILVTRLKRTKDFFERLAERSGLPSKPTGFRERSVQRKEHRRS